MVLPRTLHDIDEKEDISKFRNRMRKTLELQKSETGRYLLKKLKISVIVPIYNEESDKITAKQLIPLLDKCNRNSLCRWRKQKTGHCQ